MIKSKGVWCQLPNSRRKVRVISESYTLLRDEMPETEQQAENEEQMKCGETTEPKKKKGGKM